VQADAAPQYALSKEEQQQEYSDINAGATAAVNQDSKQIADAAGSSLFAQGAPLTDNLQLLDPAVQLQNINVDLNSVPLPALPAGAVLAGRNLPASSAPVNDAFTRYWNDSVAQLTGGPSPSFAATFGQMLASGAQSPAPADSITPADGSNENAKSLLAFTPYPYVEGIANSGLRALGDVAQYFGATGIANWLDDKQLPAPPLLLSRRALMSTHISRMHRLASLTILALIAPRAWTT
jgi:hypothetical protein